MMTEYKMSVFSFINHFPVLLLEALFIGGVIYLDFKGIVWISIMGTIVLATVITIFVNSYKVYGVSGDILQVRLGKKVIREYQLSNIKTIKERKRSMDIAIFFDGKVKTIYLGWYIGKYKKMKKQLMENIQKLDNYDRIIFVD